MIFYRDNPNYNLLRENELTTHYKFTCTTRLYFELKGIKEGNIIFPVQYATAGIFAAGITNASDELVFIVEVEPTLTNLGLQYCARVYYMQDNDLQLQTFYSTKYIPYFSMPIPEGQILEDVIEFTTNVEIESEHDLHADCYLGTGRTPYAGGIDNTCGYAKGWAGSQVFYKLKDIKLAKYYDSDGNSFSVASPSKAMDGFLPECATRISVVRQRVIDDAALLGKYGDEHINLKISSRDYKYDVPERSYEKSGIIPNSENWPWWQPRDYFYHAEFKTENNAAVFKANSNLDFNCGFFASPAYDVRINLNTIDTENKPISGVKYKLISSGCLPKELEENSPLIIEDNKIDLHYKSTWACSLDGEYSDNIIPQNDPYMYNGKYAWFRENNIRRSPWLVSINNVEELNEPAGQWTYYGDIIYFRDSRMLISQIDNNIPNLESPEILQFRFNGEQTFGYGDVSKWTAYNCTMEYDDVIGAFKIENVQEGAYIQCNFKQNDIVWGLFGSRFFRMKFKSDTENAIFKMICDDVNSWTFKAENANIVQETIFDSCAPNELGADSTIDHYKWIDANQTLIDDYKPFDTNEHGHDSRKAFGVQTVDKLKFEFHTAGAKYTIYNLKHKIYNKPRVFVIPGCAYCAPLPCYSSYPFGGDRDKQDMDGDVWVHRNAIVEVDGKFILESIAGYIISYYDNFEHRMYYPDFFMDFPFYKKFVGTRYLPYFIPTSRNIYDEEWDDIEGLIHRFQNRGQIQTNGALTVEHSETPTPHAIAHAYQILLSAGKTTIDEINDELKLNICPQIDKMTFGAYFEVTYNNIHWMWNVVYPAYMQWNYCHIYGAIIIGIVIDSFKKPVENARIKITDMVREQTVTTDNVGRFVAHVRPGKYGEVQIENKSFDIFNRMIGRVVLMQSTDGYLLYDMYNDKLHYRQSNGYLERDKEDNE